MFKYLCIKKKKKHLDYRKPKKRYYIIPITIDYKY